MHHIKVLYRFAISLNSSESSSTQSTTSSTALTESQARQVLKNWADSDYGDSFGISVQKYGLISALTRISDKFNRLESLILNKNRLVEDEELLAAFNKTDDDISTTLENKFEEYYQGELDKKYLNKIQFIYYINKVFFLLM